MKLTQKAQVTLFGACVASLIFAGTGYAQAKSVEAKYEEQSKQIELYKDELNDMQGQLQEYTKYKAMYECMAVEKDQLHCLLANTKDSSINIVCIFKITIPLCLLRGNNKPLGTVFIHVILPCNII